MTFNKNYGRKAINYEKQMQIAENKEKVETTLNCIRPYLPRAIIHNWGIDSLYKQITSVVDITNENNCFLDAKRAPHTTAQKEMMSNIYIIDDCAKREIKMSFIVDMEGRQYLSASKDKDIGACLCLLYPINASEPIILLADENQSMGLYAYVGVPSKEGVAYIFSKEKAGAFFIPLREFHFLSLRKDPAYNYTHGLLLSYNTDWNLKNISFSIILKENQDMVRQLFDSVRSPNKPMEQPNSVQMNVGTYPWQQIVPPVPPVPPQIPHC